MNNPSHPSLPRSSWLGRLVLGVVGLFPLASPAQVPAESGVPPNVIFLVDTHRSMQEFSTWLPEAFTPGYSPTTGAKQGDRGFNDPQYGHFINTGCSDPALVAGMSWFDKSSTDPGMNGSVAYDTDADLGSTFFESGRFYHSRGRRVSWQGNGGDIPSSMNLDFKGLTSPVNAKTACSQVWNYSSAYNQNPTVLNECMFCLASKGWWRGPLTTGGTSGFQGPPQMAGEPALPPEARRKWIVSGGVLNLRPPQFVMVRRVLKDVLQSAEGVRMGVASFGGDRGWFDPAWVLADMRPLSCSDAYLPLQESALDRLALTKAVNAARFSHDERSTGETLFSLGGYFSSQGVDNRWSSWFAQPVGTFTWGWPGIPNGGTVDSPYHSISGSGYAKGPDEWLKANFTDYSTGAFYPGQRWELGGNNRSICFDNQVNAVIVVTLGEPRYDNSVPITKMMSLLIAQNARHETVGKELVTFNPVDPRRNPDASPGGVNYCEQFEMRPGVMATAADCDYTGYNWPTGLLAGNKNFMDDTAFFLSHMDLRGDLSGTQRMNTYVVGYGSSHPMLKSIALAGRGAFMRADRPDELRAALEEALLRIRASAP